MSAHDVLRTVDCSFPGCVLEAEKGSDRCRDHLHEEPENESDRLARMFNGDAPPEMSVEQAVRVLNGHPPGPPPTEGEARSVTGCKIEGCSNESAGRGGSWHGLCVEHIAVEGRRRQQIARERRAVKPPPAAPAAPARKQHADRMQAPSPPREPVGPDQSAPFGGLADRVVELERQVADLEQQLVAARERLDQAAAEFVQHLRNRFGVAA